FCTLGCPSVRFAGRRRSASWPRGTEQVRRRSDGSAGGLVLAAEAGLRRVGSSTGDSARPAGTTRGCRVLSTVSSSERGGLPGLVSPLGGLVGQVDRLAAQPGELPIPVAVATLGDLTQVLPQVRRATRGAPPRHQLDGAGGAMDPEAARTIAVAEALERYAACVYDPGQFLRASADELGGEALDLDTVPRCSPAELAPPRC